jgi:hypothetical protein
MTIYNSFNELVAETQSVNTDVFVDNMSPVTHEYGSWSFEIGPEDPTQNRKHVHVKSPEGEIKIWLDPIEYDPRGDRGKFNKKDINTVLEQVEAYYEKIKQDIVDFHNGKKIKKSIGKKIKGKNRPF